MKLRARRNLVSYLELSGEGYVESDRADSPLPVVSAPAARSSKRREPSGRDLEFEDEDGSEISRPESPASIFDDSLEGDARSSPQRKTLPKLSPKRRPAPAKDTSSTQPSIKLVPSRKPSVRDAQLRALQQSSKNSVQPKSFYLAEVRLRLKEPPRSLGTIYNGIASTEYEDNSYAWSNVLSPGPVWDLVEDRAFYKETASPDTPPTRTLANGVPLRRTSPRKNRSVPHEEIQDADVPSKTRIPAYQDISVNQAGMDILSRMDAMSFLGPELGSRSPSSEPNPIACHFGAGEYTSLKSIPLFQSLRLDCLVDGSRSHIFNAGGPVWGLDWCPISRGESGEVPLIAEYLAVATSNMAYTSVPIGLPLQKPAPASLQIWSLSPVGPDDEVGVMKCEMVVCIDCGPAHAIRWCPIPSHGTGTGQIHYQKLGILAGVFADGSISFFAIPDPHSINIRSGRPKQRRSPNFSSPLFVKIKDPILRIELPGSCFWSLDWANSEVIAAGCTNGTIVTYFVKDYLAGKSQQPLLPSTYFCVHQSAVRSLAWMKFPPSDTSGVLQVDVDPAIICSVGYDGDVVYLDTRDGTIASVARYRDVMNSVVWSPWIGGCITTEYDAVKWLHVDPQMMGRGHASMSSEGQIWELATSSFHPFVASAGSDGCLQITNLYRISRKGYNIIKLAHKIYQLDYDERAKEFRMLENYLPTEIGISRAPQGAQKKGKGKSVRVEPTQEAPQSSAAWPPEVGIQRVAWCPNGLSRCHLLVSGTGSGLCRMDALWGWKTGTLQEDEEDELMED